MKRHAKASLAGSNAGSSGSSRFHRAFATRGAFGEVSGSGARRGGTAGRLALALVLVLAAFSLTAASAGAAPLVRGVSVSDVQGSTAHFDGELEPNGFAYWNFEISTDGVNWSAVPSDGLLLSTVGWRPVSSTMTGLKGGTKYLVRLNALNSFDPPAAISDSVEFETLPVAKPTVLAIEDASQVFSTTAEVSGSVERAVSADPAFIADCHFEYVTEDAFQAKDEQQDLTVRATGGTFTLGFDGQVTGPIAFDASPAAVQAELEGLTSIGAGSVAVSGGPGDEAGTAPYAITFGGALGGRDVEALAVDASGLAVEGESGAEIQTHFDGHPEGFNNPGRAACEPNPITAAGPTPVTARLTGLEPSSTYHLRLSAENAGGSDSKDAASVFTTDSLPAVDPPTVLGVDSASAITTTTANVSGSVERPAGADPLFDVDCRFEYITETQFNENEVNSLPGFEGALVTPCAPDPVTSGGVNPVTATLTGLITGTGYHLRLVGSNFGGSDSKTAGNFRTESAILVQTLPAGSVNPTSATLGGRIDPDNASVTYQFEWGEVSGPGDESYEEVTPVVPEPLGFQDKDFHFVSASLGDLEPSTAYHYRVVATDTATQLVIPGANRAFTTRPAPMPAPPCPNETSRVGPSAKLPDCRAYEWVTPDLNNATFEFNGVAAALADGSALSFQTEDAPDNAEGSFIGSGNVARRDSSGWHTQSFSPRIVEPEPAYLGAGYTLLSEDFTEAISYTSQRLAGPTSPAGANYYLRRPDGTYVALTRIGGSLSPDTHLFKITKSTWASGDFSRIFFETSVLQHPTDPSVQSTYEWSGGQLNLAFILPSGNPAVEGSLARGLFSFVSYDGDSYLFQAPGNNSLYLWREGQSTIDVAAPQRSGALAHPPGFPRAEGIAPSGTEVLFTSPSELTDDANTGETDGISTDAGRDLYSYDVESGELTDLTVDTNPADAATGANVTRVVGASKDASYIYFLATGDLAEGAVSGEQNLYVEHEGTITYITGGGVQEDTTSQTIPFYVTPDGRHAAFTSSANLVGYDSAGQVEVYEYAYEGELLCASCRPSGAPPTADSSIHRRALSDDGSRVFFQSSDAVLPAAANGLSNVYEYEGGETHLLTPGDGDVASFLLDASASGDDVFIATHERFDLEGQTSPLAIYDARVNAVVPRSQAVDCLGASCLDAATGPPAFGQSGSAEFEAQAGVGAPGSKTVNGVKTRLRVTVPEPGQISVSGRGLTPARKTVNKGGSVTFLLALKPSAARVRLRSGVYRTKAKFEFKARAGGRATAVVSLAFKTSKKGGKR